jgi:hypothetical protein
MFTLPDEEIDFIEENLDIFEEEFLKERIGEINPTFSSIFLVS